MTLTIDADATWPEEKPCTVRKLETVAILEVLNSAYHPWTIDMSPLIFGEPQLPVP